VPGFRRSAPILAGAVRVFTCYHSTSAQLPLDGAEDAILFPTLGRPRFAGLVLVRALSIEARDGR